MLNTANTKGRVAKGVFKYGSRQLVSELCGPMIPDMLPSGDPSKVCPISITPGREWYCTRPVSATTCGKYLFNGDGEHGGNDEWPQKEDSDFLVSELTNPMGLDRVCEDLVYSREVKVVALNPSNSPPSGADTDFRTYHNFQGLWLNGVWVDKILGTVMPTSKIDQSFANKTFMYFGDSLSKRIGHFIEEKVVGKGNLNFTGGHIAKNFTFFNLTQDYWTPKCRQVWSWGPEKKTWSSQKNKRHFNFTIVLVVVSVFVFVFVFDRTLSFH